MAKLKVDTIVLLSSEDELPWDFENETDEMAGPFVGKSFKAVLRDAGLDPKDWRIFPPDPMAYGPNDFETLWIGPAPTKKPAKKSKKKTGKKSGSKTGSKKTGSKSAKNPSRRRNPTLADVTDHDIEQALARPDSFGYSGDRPMFETWSLGPVVNHRDATLLAKANWAALEKELENIPSWEGQWETTGANHWAVGWVEHLSFQVLDDNEEPTEIFRFLKGWFDGLRDYPIASDSIYSEMQSAAYEERLESDLGSLERSKLIDDLPEDWRDQFFEKLRELEWEYDSEDVPYHDDATLEQVAEELGFLDDQYAENPEHDPVYLVMRDRSAGTIRGGQILAMDHDRDGTIHVVLYNDDTGDVWEWTFHSSTGWTTQKDRNREYDLLAAVTRSENQQVPNPIGPGFGGWLGWALGSTVATLTSLIFGVGMPGALLTGWTLGTLGAALGSYQAAPDDRQKRSAIGAGLGNAIFPILGIGAALGGWIGAKQPDRHEVQDASHRRGAMTVERNPMHRKIKSRVLR